MFNHFENYFKSFNFDSLVLNDINFKTISAQSSGDLARLFSEERR